MLKSSSLALLLLGVSLIGGSTAFFGGAKPSGGSPKVSSQADEAVAIYGGKYPFDRPPPSKNALVSFGMPGTKTYGPESRRRLTDKSEANVRATFEELATNYGADNALTMVKAMPLCLSFDKSNFAPSLSSFADIFGLEEAQEMVQRNPGLLAVKPKDAATSDDQTMVFSYIVAVTRPVGPLLLGSLLIALLSLPVESVTGVSLRSVVFGQ